MTHHPLFSRVLVANRGEIALRIVRALQDLGVASVAVFADDDAGSPHVAAADAAVALGGTGPAAYLDADRLVAVARAQGCDAVHPGYGFLSEQAAFARACATAGLCFIGPTPEQLELLGDKARARALAQQHGVPVLPGTPGPVTLEQAQAFWHDHADVGVLIKAVGGGGGRGMRAVREAADLPAAYQACVREALATTGVAEVVLERRMAGARHIEVQVLGDGQAVMALGERECSVQRRFQKLVEVAPSPTLTGPLRAQLTDSALTLARAVAYQGLGTFEFLVRAEDAAMPYAFIEANPRLQVEHTVTEAVTGVDLVQAQIALAAGQSLADLGLDPAAPPVPQGVAVQWRIQADWLGDTAVAADGAPHAGRLQRFDLPAGPGIRVDTHGRAGAAVSPHYDPLLAKLVVHHRSPHFADVLRRSQRALAECGIDGIPTNLALLQAVAEHPDMARQTLHTGWLEAVWPDLLNAAKSIARKQMQACDDGQKSAEPALPTPMESPATHAPGTVRAPLAARVVQVAVAVGQPVAAGAELAVLEAMKMEHAVLAPCAGQVQALWLAPGDTVAAGQPLVHVAPADGVGTAATADATPADPDHIRPDLQRLRERLAFTQDAARPEAMARRHAQGGRSARENIADLCDAGSFIEYGALAIAAQTRRRSVEDLIAHTPADGMVTGIGGVNGALFGPEVSRTVVMAYDATVLAGTQGARNHAKTDRMLGIALAQRLPVVLFAEGGGGRPGDTDMPVVAGLHVPTFGSYAALSGQVPVVGIAAGRCFAGNAALLGCSDVVIATRTSNIGLGGPAMVEGGGLGVFRPEQIGPVAVQHANGVIDLLVDDEAGAVAAARHYLGFFQGRTAHWTAPDARTLRAVVPENRLRAYDTQAALQGLADAGSLLPLRTGFGVGVHTALARIEGRPVGLLASNPLHLGGAIDADAADKAARFLQLCNAHGLPVVSLVDTPGFMVGPAAETTAQVRHVSRLFVTAASLRVPVFSVVLRKGYGLGAMAMAAGGFHAPVFTVAWPTGEFGAMGLEGAVRLGFRKELEAVPAGAERDALFQTLLARQVADGAAQNMAATLEIDAVIDPADTRDWLARGLASARVGEPRSRFVDPW